MFEGVDGEEETCERDQEDPGEGGRGRSPEGEAGKPARSQSQYRCILGMRKRKIYFVESKNSPILR